ncbi:type I polyketide synthase [Streptomyces chartreusis]|uniref:type I polyketide synthase n=1 Tax=Streptomyces chartreusis TaxID=1969 RepID=UPI0036BFE69F
MAPDLDTMYGKYVTDTELSPIAIIGMSCKFPGASGLHAFWENLQAGVDSITRFQKPVHLNAATVSAKGVLEGADLFDPEAFGLSPREAELMDPQHRQLLEGVWTAFETAGYDPFSFQVPVGVFAGCSNANTYYQHNLHAVNLSPSEAHRVLLVNANDFLSTRVSHIFGFTGPSMTVQSGCSTSLVAVHTACNSLLNYECDVAVAGAVSVTMPLTEGPDFEEGMIFSPDGYTRAFDEGANGTVLGNGVGVVLLKRFEDAIAEQDNIQAVIMGSAINNDGCRKTSFTAPSVQGQADVIAQAHAIAGVAPTSISYVEAHATGTKLGDPIEVEALKRAYGADAGSERVCALGSVKTNIGHLDAAAGMAGLIKTVLMLQHKQLVPSLHLSSENPKIDLPSSPFYISTDLRDWTTGETPRRAGVSSLGMGGTNAHLVLQEHCPEEDARNHRSGAGSDSHVLLLSAKTGQGVRAAAASLSSYLLEHPEIPVGDAEYTLSVGRPHLDTRAYVHAATREEAIEELAALGAGDRHLVRVEPGQIPTFSFMFPGQGTRYAGSASGIYEKHSAFRRMVDTCSEILQPHLGADVRDFLFIPAHFPATAEQCAETAVAQPALFTLEYSLAHLWQHWGITPTSMIGHSLGEYVAACVAGVFSLEDALHAVSVRGRLMQDTPPGKMLAVLLSEDELLQRMTPGVALAAVNSSGQCVVSGREEPVKKFAQELQKDNVACTLLPSNRAFHSPLLRDAADTFGEFMATVPLRTPRIPFISNITGDWIREEQAADPDYWASHMCEPVRFSAGLTTLTKQGRAGHAYIEAGPGDVLARLLRAENPAGDVAGSLPSSAPARAQRLPTMSASAASLWALGARIDWNRVHQDAEPRRTALPTYPFTRRRYWFKRGSTEAGISKSNSITHTPFWRQSRVKADTTVGKKVRFLVLADSTSQSDDLIRELKSRGHEVFTAHSSPHYTSAGSHDFTICPDRTEHYEKLLSGINAQGGPPEHIVAVWNFHPEATDPDTIPDTRDFAALVSLAQALGKMSSSERSSISILASGSVKVLGTDPLSPVQSLAHGVSRVLPLEYPGLSCRVIDLHPETCGPDAARTILDEMTITDRESLVAYRGGTRWVQDIEECTGSVPSPLKRGGLFVITGGLGGIGLTIAGDLAQNLDAHCALISRTPVPEDAMWAEILEQKEHPAYGIIKVLQQFQNSGMRFSTHSADVADESSLRAAFCEIVNTHGSIDGVIHAAGVPGGKLIQHMTVDDSRLVMQSKLHGTVLLDRIMDEMSIDPLILCSSLSALVGSIGQASYCAANAFLDAFAYDRSSRGRRTVSLNWDIWAEVGMGAAAAKAALSPVALDPLYTQQHHFIHPTEGSAAVHAALATENPQVIISKRPGLGSMLQNRAADYLSTGHLDVESSVHDRPQLKTPYEDPVGKTEKAIAAVWRELLAIDRVGRHDDFFELGGTSLSAVAVISAIRRTLQENFPSHSLVQNPTIAQLAASVATEKPSRTQDDCLVRIKVGTSGARPLFLVHPVGGHVYMYRELAEHLNPDQPVYGIQADSDTHSESIEQLAEKYLRLVMQEVPNGDFLLGGSSFGGIVAFEMAQRMQAQGYPCPLLIMIDSPGPGYMPSLPKNAADIARYFLGLEGNEEKTLALASTESQESGAPLADLHLLPNLLPSVTEDEWRKFVSLYARNAEAMIDYKPKSYSGGPVLFFRATEIDAYNPEHPENAWIPLVSADFTLHDTPGNHLTMNLNPHVRFLGGTLQAYIDRL